MRALPLLVLTLLGLASACGPVAYIGQVTRRASAEVAAAKAAGADRLAPYEYTAAVEYLKKAREEAGYAEFQVAVRLGKKAEELAVKAQEIARSKPATPVPAAETVPPPPTKPKPGKYVPPEED